MRQELTWGWLRGLGRADTAHAPQDRQSTTLRVMGVPHPPPPGPNSAYLQATPGVCSVNFRTVVFGGAFFKWSSCVLRVLCDTWGLRCVVLIFCVKEAEWGMMAFVAYLARVFVVHRVFLRVPCTVYRGSNKQHWAPVPSISGHFLLLGKRGVGGGDGTESPSNGQGSGPPGQALGNARQVLTVGAGGGGVAVSCCM